MNEAPAGRLPEPIPARLKIVTSCPAPVREGVKLLPTNPVPPVIKTFIPFSSSCYGISPNPAEPEPRRACRGMDEFPANPPNTPFVKGGPRGISEIGCEFAHFSADQQHFRRGYLYSSSF